MTTPRYVKRRLNFSCDIERDNGTSQLADGWIEENWSSVGTSVPCKYWEESESYVSEAEGYVTVKSRMIMFEHNQDVEMDDRLSNLKDSDDVIVGIGTAAILEPETRRDIAGDKAFVVAEVEKVETNG